MPLPYMRVFGPQVVEHGYRIVPIRPGTKAPPNDGWQNSKTSPKTVQRWLESGRGGYGVGILTEDTPAVDLDTMDATMAADMVAFVQREFGPAPVRVGMAPKTLLLFRASETFTKVKSSVWNDPNGPLNPKTGKPYDHAGEILGKGQQFVAFADHPDTRQPYAWISSGNPATIDASDLPPLGRDAALAIAAEFDRLAEARGWVRKRPGANGASVGRTINTEWDADIAERVTMSLAQVRDTLMLIPNDAADYDSWLNNGMATWHQTEGSAEGFEIWVEWSSQSWKHNLAECEKKWRSFNEAGKGRAPITFRTVIREAKEFKAAVAEATAQETDAAFRAATTKGDYEKALTAAKRADITQNDRNALVPIVQETYQRVFKAKLSITDARRALRAEREVPAMPAWLEGWAYDRAAEGFVNLNTLQSASTKGFDDQFGAHLLTKADLAEGKLVPDTRPSTLALNLYRVDQIDGVRYAPGEPAMFNRDGRVYANRYSEANLPPMPAVLTATHFEYIRRFRDHISHLVEDVREQEIFLSWFAHLVQTRRRINWALVIQGTEGDGKTWFGRMMEKILGVDNVHVVDSKSFQDGFNAWAEESLLNMVEEIRVAGKNRFEMMDNIKPYITNSRIAVRRMRTDAYQADNTASYFLATNHQDAIPVTLESTRYFIVRSQWQTKSAIDAFKADNPDYYEELWEMVIGDNDAAGAIRHYLMHVELHPEFDASNRAPRSAGREYMASVTREGPATVLHEILNEEYNHRISRDLVVVNDLVAAVNERIGEPLTSRGVSAILQREGFEYLGRFRISNDEQRITCWTQNRKRFSADTEKLTSDIREYIARGHEV